MTGSCTCENGIVGRIRMTIRACVPFVFMLAGIDRKILRVMVPVGGRPCRLCMAIGTCGWELRCRMARVGRLVVVCQMAPCTGVGCCVVIPVVTGIAGNRNVGTGNNIVVVVDRECGRCPVWICCVAGIACCRVIAGNMVRVHR